MGIRVAPAGSLPAKRAGQGAVIAAKASCKARRRPGSSAEDKAEKFRNPAGLGFVRLAQPLGFARLRGDLKFPDGPAATGPRLNGRWEFYPISVALTISI